MTGLFLLMAVFLLSACLSAALVRLINIICFSVDLQVNFQTYRGIPDHSCITESTAARETNVVASHCQRAILVPNSRLAHGNGLEVLQLLAYYPQTYPVVSIADSVHDGLKLHA